MYVIHSRHVLSYLFALISVFINIQYFQIANGATFVLMEERYWLISIVLPLAIASYSHLYAEYANGEVKVGNVLEWVGSIWPDRLWPWRAKSTHVRETSVIVDGEQIVEERLPQQDVAVAVESHEEIAERENAVLQAVHNGASSVYTIAKATNINASTLRRKTKEGNYSGLIERLIGRGLLRDDNGTISPLLANIALHGMEEALGIRYNRAGELIGKRGLVKYADDFVVFCANEEDAQAVISLLTEWLETRGLTLSSEKTSIRHITEGFDFLGFNVRQYAMPHTTRTGWKVLIKPSRQSVAKLKEKLRQEWVALRGHNPDAVVRRLNPIIRGWANYFRTGVSSKIFSDLDSWMFTRQVLYAKQRHRNKPWPWIRARYWGKFNPHSKSQWVFGDCLSGHYLLRFGEVRIQRHIMVKGASSPDDPALKLYWQQRNARKAADLPPKYQPLSHRQYNLCYHCGDSLFNGEEVHRHHIIPLEDGGQDHFSNIVFVHLFCHQQLHARQSDSASSN